MNIVPIITPLDDRPGTVRDGREVERIFDAMLGEIISGVFPPGMKLNEADLAARFGVKRGPLREAIRRLQGRGLLVCQPNAGARVIIHSPREVLDTYHMRESVESFAARLAAHHMTEAEIDQLRQTTADSKAGKVAPPDQPTFHLQIMRGSGNYAIRKLLDEEFYQLLTLWQASFPWLRHRDDRSWFDHERIIEAIAYRDGDCAELLMRNHLRRLRNVIQDNLLKSGFQAEPARPG
jgi:DNA-binding GntR family transcriptional regulator